MRFPAPLDAARAARLFPLTPTPATAALTPREAAMYVALRDIAERALHPGCSAADAHCRALGGLRAAGLALPPPLAEGAGG